MQMRSAAKSNSQIDTPQQMSDALGYIKQGSQLLKNRGVNNAANVSMAALNVYTEGAKLAEVISAAKTAATIATTASTAATATTAAAATSTFASTAMTVAPFAAAAFAAFSLVSSLLDDDDEDEAAMAIMQGLSMISNQVYNMHSDMNRLFDISFDFHRQTLNLINDTCKLLHDKIHSSIHEFCLPAIQSLGNQLNLWCKTITDGQDVIALAPYRELKRDIDGVIKGIISGSKEKLEEINLKAFSWLKQGGEAALPMHTGAKFFLEAKSELDRNKWINDVALSSLNEESLKENYGFLAYYAFYVLGIQFCDKTIIQSVFNSSLWHALAEQYIVFRLQFDKSISDPGNTLLNQIEEAAIAQLTYIQGSQESKELIPTLFNNYQNSIKTVIKLIEDAFIEENKKLDEEKLGLDIRRDIQTNIDLFENKSPRNTFVKGGPRVYQDGKLYDITFSQLYLSTIFKDTLKIPAILLASEFFGLSNLQMEWRITLTPDSYGPDSDFNRVIDIKIKDESANRNWVTLTQLYRSHRYTQQAIQFHQNINDLTKQESEKINQHLLQKRKNAVRLALSSPKLESLFQSIDANLRLLIAYAITIGLRAEEVKLIGELWSSNNVLTHLKTYLDSATIETPLPNQTIAPNFQEVCQATLEKLEKHEDNYFQHPIEKELRNILIGLNLVRMKSTYNPIDTCREIYSHYTDNFEIWSSDDYLDAISAKKKTGATYKKFIQDMQAANELFNQINKALTEQNIDLISLIKNLKKLNALCIELHQNLQFLAPNYPFKDNGTKFKFLASDSEELDKLEKHYQAAQNTQEEKGSFTKKPSFFSRRNRVGEILSKTEMRATLGGNPIYFARIRNNGTNSTHQQSGSCGYISMNVPRDEVKRVLEQALEQKEETSLEIRKLIGGQIANDFREGCLRLSDDNTKKLSELMEAFSVSQELSSSSSASAGQAQQAEQNLMVFLCDKELAKDYFKHNILDTWMPMRAAKAYAMATDTPFTVFGINTQPKAGDKDPDDLYPIEMESFKATSTSTRKPKNIIFMGNHYEELVEVPSPTPQLAVN